MLLDAFFTVLRPWPLKVVIDRVIASKPRPSRVPFLGHWLDQIPLEKTTVLYGACCATLCIAVATGLLTYFYTNQLGRIGQQFVSDVRQDLFAHMQRLSLRFHDGQRTGDLITRLTNDVQAIQEIVASGTIVLGSNVFLLACMLGVMLWLNWQFALVALAFSPILFYSVFRYSERIRIAARQARASTGSLASFAQETLASIRIVQGLAQEDQQDDRFRLQNAAGLAAYLDTVRYQARVAPMVDVLAAAGTALVMWYGAAQVLRGHLTTGDVVVFFAYVTNLYSPIRALSKSSYALSKAAVASERIAEVMAVPREVADRPNAVHAPRFKGNIEFQGVTFGYNEGRPILSDINFAIEQGQTVALVGPTGSGKSSIVSLLLRFYDAQHGSITIDGVDIRAYFVRDLRDQISLVLQDALLFSGTISENIAFGRPDASEQDIRTAALLANADEFIQNLPNRYHSIVAEFGSTLSGGQKQRIALARAVLRDSPIFVLDEPTSSLDPVSEAMVLDALAQATAGRTTLIVTHRLSTIRPADRIIVIEHGCIVESGNHDSLIRAKGKYADLYQEQYAR